MTKRTYAEMNDGNGVQSGAGANGNGVNGGAGANGNGAQGGIETNNNGAPAQASQGVANPPPPITTFSQAAHAVTSAPTLTRLTHVLLPRETVAPATAPETNGAQPARINNQDQSPAQ